MKKMMTIAMAVAIVSGTAAEWARADRVLGRRRELRKAVEEEVEQIEDGGTVIGTTHNGDADLNAAIPAGARALVKIGASLDSSKHGKGHRFTGILEADIVSGDAVIAEQGSQVHGQIVSAQRPLRTVGQSSLGLKITGIMVGSQLRTIESATVMITSARTGADTARKVGGAAAIGGLADGSDGAEVGVKVGAATSLVSKGQTAAIAAGTVMEFIIGEPGSGVANQVAEESTQPPESSTERVQDRRRDRRR